MKIDVQPGSIKDQALQLIARGPVTRTQLGSSIPCNGALLNIALDGMERDQWIRKNEHGAYELLVEIDVAPPPKIVVVDVAPDKPAKKAGEQGGSAPGLNGTARAEPRASRPAVCDSGEKDMGTESQLKYCPACGEDKRRHQDFDPGSQRCKQCVKENRPKLKPHERIARATISAAEARTKPPQVDKAATEVARHTDPPRAEFVIPAEGSLLCRFDGDRFEIRQGTQLITGSFSQLARLTEWGQSVVGGAS